MLLSVAAWVGLRGIGAPGFGEERRSQDDGAQEGVTTDEGQARSGATSMQVNPSTAAPGEEVEVHFPESVSRGVGYVMEAPRGSDWTPRYLLTSTVYGSTRAPQWAPADAPYRWPDIGVVGAGPERIQIPDTAEPGWYRLCTANSSPTMCAALEVVAS